MHCQACVGASLIFSSVNDALRHPHFAAAAWVLDLLRRGLLSVSTCADCSNVALLDADWTN